MYLDPITHTYRHGEHTFGKSVTELVNQYVPEFQAEMIAEKVANKEGRTTTGVLRQWKLAGELATNYGNAVHKTIEYWIDFKQKPSHTHLQEILDNFLQIYGDKELVSEIAVYDVERDVCGTVDLLQVVAPKTVKIIDIKTNGDLHKKGHGKLLAPFQDLENNNINKYRLQLSIYKKLFEGRGYKVPELEIWHPEEGVISIDEINIDEIWHAN